MKWIIFIFTIFCFCFVSADVVSIGATGGDEILLGYGNQIDLFFTGTNVTVTDAIDPVVTKLAPVSGLSTTERQINYIYNVSDTNNILSCSLLMNGAIVSTDTSVNKDISNIFDYTQSEGTFIWSIECIDEYSNTGTSGNFSIQFYTETGGGTIGIGGGYDYYSECYYIVNQTCKYIAVYDSNCPNDYFTNISSCNEALEEINLTLYDKFLEWSHSTFVNQTDNQTVVTETKRIINKIPRDLNKAFTYLALKLTPSNELRGKWIIAIFLILLIFLEETLRLIKKTKIKDKW